MSRPADLDIQQALLEGARDRLRALGPSDRVEALLVIRSLRDAAISASITQLLPLLDGLANELDSDAEGAVGRATEVIRTQLELLDRQTPDDQADDLEESFIEEAAAHFEVVRSLLGSETIDQAGLAEIRRVVHTLKGTAAMVGRPECSSAAHLIEELLQEIVRGERLLDEALLRRLTQALDLFEGLIERPAEAKELEVALLVLLGSRGPEVPSSVQHRSSHPPWRQDSRRDTSASIRVPLSWSRELSTLCSETDQVTRWLVRDLGLVREVVGELEELREQALSLARTGGDELLTLAEALTRRGGRCEQALDRIERAVARLERTTGRSMELLGEARRVPVSWIFDRLEAAAEEVAGRSGRQLVVSRLGDGLLVERGLASWVVEPLLHLVRNSVAHGLETPAQRSALGKMPSGHIAFEAYTGPGWVGFAVSDDGQGVDLEAIRRQVVAAGIKTAREVEVAAEAETLDWIFLPGVSSRGEVDELAGRGVGLDAVQAEVARRGGLVEVETNSGRGARFQLKIFSASETQEVVLFEVAGVKMAVAADAVRRVSLASEVDHIERCSLADLLGLPRRSRTTAMALHLAGAVVEVDRVLGLAHGEIHGLEGRLAMAGPYAGALVVQRDRASLALLLDVDRLVERLPLGDAGVRALLVEDSPTARRLYCRALREAGLVVVEAVDGVEALSRLDEESVDLLVSDIHMPRLDGLALVERVRADPRFDEMPILLFSSKATSRVRRCAEALGVSAVVGKEGGVAALVEAVDEALSFSRPLL